MEQSQKEKQGWIAAGDGNKRKTEERGGEMTNALRKDGSNKHSLAKDT